jgi:hypothetical protein
MSEKTKTRTFRPWPKNRERLELADKLGLNVSELLNEMLDKHFKEQLETKTKKLRDALASV